VAGEERFDLDAEDASIEKDCLRGKYGAVPFLGDAARIFAEDQQPAKTIH
jgi:hypothetical protein